MCFLALAVVAVGCSSGAHNAAPPSTNTSTTATPRASAYNPPPPPVLGRSWQPHQRGYGEMERSTIDNGGDPTGLVEHIRWQSWGGSRAIGSGSAEWLGPNQFSYQATPAAATIVAFNLGVCRGRLAYTAIAWYFPEHDQHFTPSTHINICTGEYVGSNGAVPPSA
jgi:hypothetical protein